MIRTCFAKVKYLDVLSRAGVFVYILSVAPAVGRPTKWVYRDLRRYEEQALVEIRKFPKGLAVRITPKGVDRLNYLRGAS